MSGSFGPQKTVNLKTIVIQKNQNLDKLDWTGLGPNELSIFFLHNSGSIVYINWLTGALCKLKLWRGCMQLVALTKNAAVQRESRGGIG